MYIALGILPDGTKDILGIWIEQTEGAKFWLRVMNELKNRGVADILIAVVDGLKGFPDAINAAFPETIVQTCIVHLLRNSMSFASWKDRKPIAQALRAVYRADIAEAGLAALDAFEAGHWGKRHPAIALSWRRHWDQVIPFFAFPEGVRRIIYTTNAIEALNSKLRRAVRTRGHFPGDDAAMKLLYLVLNKAAARVVRGKDPVRRDLRRKVRHLMTVTGPAHKITNRPQSNDIMGVRPLINGISFDALLADKAFDANWLRADITQRGAQAVIPPRKHRKTQIDYDPEMYKWRHLVENYFAKIKEFRDIATRYDKTDDSFRANINLTATLIACK